MNMPDDNPRIDRRQALAWLASAAAALSVPWSARAQARPWSNTVAAARGQTVFFNAWAGSDRTNAYLQWVAGEVQKAYGIKLEHVKITDTADVVKRVRAEKAAGRGARQGTVDLVWINGENFAAMKADGLLFGPWAEQLPHFAQVDTVGKPTTLNDFSVPTDGMESPWGMAQFTFFADSRRLPEPPQSMNELLALARQQRGRITYPRPPDFTGTTFLKQALIETVADRTVLGQPPVVADFERVTAPLWRLLDELHPHLWRDGRQFPQSPAAIRQMVADGELLLGMTFNPNEAANEIAARRLPATIRSWQFAGGTIGNTHFVAIPYNARAPEAAQVVANFLLSARAQARKADITAWGDPTVLDLARLSPEERAEFPAQALPGQVSTPAPTLPEPHATWVDPLEREWIRRYGR
ncbi:MAG TPA: ABC transporter substrate-binding protein [Hydrogenophaga sp.]|uniref:ABC transporter substrate-binding protein n=1 Tax=Hydrogenophaga sp. TaxID=1904254 RepID=UPI002BB5A23F|nr:ABC transporter substrate-binding protein [Hydrogenophaga sp.]HMN94710.1 ABC transporter substrate-binding protein [Hydrogenophaga sp.]HMP08922.1 ABC transporter substrate-binding protein [Hydrogenophaga sp.]